MDWVKAAKIVIDFEKSLQIGSEVYALWTNCYRYRCIKAKIVKINNKSFMVELIEAKDGYEVGTRINLPNFINPKWSTNNRVYTTEIN